MSADSCLSPLSKGISLLRPALQNYICGGRISLEGLERPGIAVGDFNRDGKPEAVVTNDADNMVSVLLGKADGSLNPKTDYRPFLFVTVDADQDASRIV